MKVDSPETKREASTIEWSRSQEESRDRSTLHDDLELAKNEPEAWSRFVIPSDISQCGEVIDITSRLGRFVGVPSGATIVALPALNKSGLWTHVEQPFPTRIDRRFQEIALTLIAVLHLSQFPSIEALQFVAPAEWRTVFCQDRIPTSRTLGEIIHLIGNNAGRVAGWKTALAAAWINEPPYSDVASSTSGTLLEFIGDRFQKYQRDNGTLDRLCEDITSLTGEALEPGRGFSKTDATRKPTGKNQTAATGYAQSGEIANRADDSRLMRVPYLDSGTKEFISAIKLIAFRAEQMIIRILLENIPDYESADSILKDIFKGPADLVPNFEQRGLTVWLRSLASRRHKEVLQHLYSLLTATGTLFPGTDLRLIYRIAE